MKFELSEEQTHKFNQWAEQQNSKARTKDNTGFRYKFQFCPTSLGDCVKVIDALTQEELDLTDYDL